MRKLTARCASLMLLEFVDICHAAF